MKPFTLLFSLVLVLTLSPWAAADTLRLQDGRTVEGTFLGGDSRSVKFIGDDGNVSTYQLSDVDQIIFGSGEASATSASAAPPPLAAPDGVTIPAGTVVTVRLIDSIDSDITGAGERFRASIDDPLVIDGKTVIPRNADATVQVVRTEQAGTISGADEIALKLESVQVAGKKYEIATNYAEVASKGKGKQTAKTTAATTGVGAALGAIFGGGKGAAIGAGAGAATGVAVSAARGKNLRLPSETRLDFVLRTPLTM